MNFYLLTSMLLFSFCLHAVPTQEAHSYFYKELVEESNAVLLRPAYERLPFFRYLCELLADTRIAEYHETLQNLLDTHAQLLYRASIRDPELFKPLFLCVKKYKDRGVLFALWYTQLYTYITKLFLAIWGERFKLFDHRTTSLSSNSWLKLKLHLMRSFKKIQQEGNFLVHDRQHIAASMQQILASLSQRVLIALHAESILVLRDTPHGVDNYVTRGVLDVLKHVYAREIGMVAQEMRPLLERAQKELIECFNERLRLYTARERSNSF